MPPQNLNQIVNDPDYQNLRTDGKRQVREAFYKSVFESDDFKNLDEKGQAEVAERISEEETGAIEPKSILMNPAFLVGGGGAITKAGQLATKGIGRVLARSAGSAGLGATGGAVDPILREGFTKEALEKVPGEALEAGAIFGALEPVGELLFKGAKAGISKLRGKGKVKPIELAEEMVVGETIPTGVETPTLAFTARDKILKQFVESEKKPGGIFDPKSVELTKEMAVATKELGSRELAQASRKLNFKPGDIYVLPKEVSLTKLFGSPINKKGKPRLGNDVTVKIVREFDDGRVQIDLLESFQRRSGGREPTAGTLGFGRMIVKKSELQTAIIKDSISKPTVISGNVVKGEIKTTLDSGKTFERAVKDFDIETTPFEELKDAAPSIRKAIDEQLPGLEKTNLTIDEVIGPKSTPIETGVSGTPSPPTIPAQQGPLDPSRVGKPLWWQLRPTYEIMNVMERESGLPFVADFHLSRVNAAREAMEFKLAWAGQQFKFLNKVMGFTQKKIRARERVQELLPRIESVDTEKNLVTYLDDTGNLVTKPRASIPGILKANKDEVDAAIDLRRMYDQIFRQGFEDPKRYMSLYGPAQPIKTPQDLAKMNFDPRFDKLMRAEHFKTGELFPRETDALRIFDNYVRDFVNTKFLFKWEEEVASKYVGKVEYKPVIMGKGKKVQIQKVQTEPGLLTDDGARLYIQSIIDDTRGIARNADVTTNKLLHDKFFEPLLWRFPKLKEDLMAFLGTTEGREAKAISDKLIVNFYRSFTYGNPWAAIMQHSQKLMWEPIIGGNWRRGLRELGRDSQAYARGLRAGLQGPFVDLVEKAPAGFIERVTGGAIKPGKWFKAGDFSNRLVGFNFIHNRVRDAARSKLTWEQFVAKNRKDIAFDLLTKSNVELAESQYKAGRVGDVLDIGIDNNAAFTLGNIGSDITQHPYSVASGPEFFRRSMFHRQAGVFQTWFIYFSDYMAKLTKRSLIDTKGKVNKAKAVGRLMRMAGYLTLADGLFQATTGQRLYISPLSTFGGISGGRAGIPAGPLIQQSVVLAQFIGNVMRQMDTAMLSESKRNYAKFEAEMAKRNLIGGAAINIPGGVAAKRIIKSFGESTEQKKERIRLETKFNK